jgi:hypothetical protein
MFCSMAEVEDMNADVLREMIREAARTAFAAVRRKQPGERFYVFALQSLDDASGVYAHANTEEGYQRTLAQRRAEPWRLKEQVEEQYLRWYWGEWEHQNVEFPSFGGIYKLLNSAVHHSPRSWVAWRAAVFAAMVGALADLDAEGVFGQGTERERLTLFCTVHDSFCREWVERESAARLNSPRVFHMFSPHEVEPCEHFQSVFHAFVGQLNVWGLRRHTESSAMADGVGVK